MTIKSSEIITGMERVLPISVQDLIYALSSAFLKISFGRLYSIFSWQFPSTISITSGVRS